VKPVVAGLEPDILKDEEEGGHANRQPENIDRGKGAVTPQCPKSDGEIIL
jgi:hypothetical protein